MGKKLVAFGMALAVSLTIVMSASPNWTKLYSQASVYCRSENIMEGLGGWLSWIVIEVHECSACEIDSDGGMSPIVIISASLDHVFWVRKEFAKCDNQGDRMIADIYEWRPTPTHRNFVKVKKGTQSCVPR